MKKKLKYKGLSKSSSLSRSTPITGKRYRETTPFLSPLEFKRLYEKVYLKNGFIKFIKKKK